MIKRYNFNQSASPNNDRPTSASETGKLVGTMARGHGKAILKLSAVALLAYFGKRKFDQLSAEAREEGMSLKEYIMHKYGDSLGSITSGANSTKVDDTRPSNPLLAPYR